jgi:hypothetical protein
MSELPPHDITAKSRRWLHPEPGADLLIIVKTDDYAV